MAENSKIEWCDHTFNPWFGCTKVSPACDNCYAEKWAKRAGVAELWFGKNRRRSSDSNWRLPLKWNTTRHMECSICGWRGKCEAELIGCGNCGSIEQMNDVRPRVFCGSLCDVFDNAVSDEWRYELFQLIEKASYLDWLLLAKRIGNADEMLPFSWAEGWPNVWLGITVCNQEEADRDIPKLLQIPAVKRFLSIEPMLGAIDLEKPMPGADIYQGDGSSICQPWTIQSGIDWVIVGGESGKNARPMHPDWLRGIRDKCAAAGVPFMFKQWGEYHPSMWIEGGRLNVASFSYKTTKCAGTEMVRVGKKAAGRRLDGVLHNGYPKNL